MSGCDVITLSSEDEKDHETSKKRTVIVNKQETLQHGRRDGKNKMKRIAPVKVSKDCNLKEKTSGNEMSDKKNGEHKEEQDIFQKFVDTCFKYDNSKSMHVIVDSKLKRYYDNSNPAYVGSKQFIDLITKQIDNMISNPKNIFVPIKDVVDELRARRLKKGEPPEKRQKLLSGEASTSVSQEAGDTKDADAQPKVSDRLVRKLCKTLEILHRRIKKLEEKEVDWDEDNDSTYLQLQRFKERFCKVHLKLQEYEGEGGEGSRKLHRRIVFSGTQFPTVNRAIEKFVNKKGEFPDYFDVLKLLKATYEAENIKISPEKLRIQAKSAFQDIGGQLQKQRQFDCWDSHCMYLGANQDPAELDDSLQAKLQKNQDLYGNRISEVINEFAVKESTQNLQPEEVKDEDADKSEEETNPKNGDEEDDEDDDDEEEDDDKDFVDKVLKGEDDLKDNLSSDGDDGTRFDYHYAGPVSPPTLELEDPDRNANINRASSDSESSVSKSDEETKCKQDTLKHKTKFTLANNSKKVSVTKEKEKKKRLLTKDSSLKSSDEEVGPKRKKKSLPKCSILNESVINNDKLVPEQGTFLESLSLLPKEAESETKEELENTSSVLDKSGVSELKEASDNLKLHNNDLPTTQLATDNKVVGDGHLNSDLQPKAENSVTVKEESEVPKKIVRVRPFGSFEKMEANLRKQCVLKKKSKGGGGSDDDIIMLD